MKTLSEKNPILIVIIAAAVLLIFNQSTLISWLIPPLALWYFAVLFLFKKEEKCRLYRWIVGGISTQTFMSGWGVWRATGNILSGLMAYLLVFSFNVIPYLFIRTEHYTVLGFVSGLIPTFIILHWVWKRLPEETKVYGWT
ncbi:MAG: hypothetical protein D4R88_07870 [Methanosarcinales archaeon]|nr:MAG: hypothetical protein D4R88_07870 [Methanosarcinales archaeon]